MNNYTDLKNNTHKITHITATTSEEEKRRFLTEIYSVFTCNLHNLKRGDKSRQQLFMHANQQNERTAFHAIHSLNTAKQ